MLNESQIIFVDNHLLIVNKPSGLLTQPSGTQEDSLEMQSKAWIKKLFKKPGNVFLEAVHRLDKPVSGIVVFARTSKALSRLNQFQREHHFQKTYLAIVESLTLPIENTLEDYLIHDDHRAFIVDKSKSDAKYCRLDYRVIQKSAHHSLVEIDLKTGRYHQIRAQFAYHNAPIVGDLKYGALPSNLLQREQIALHHYKLVLQHPISQEPLEFKCPFVIKRSFFNELPTG